MLDRIKLSTALAQHEAAIFSDHSAAYDCAKTVWQKITTDPIFAHKVAMIDFPLMLPRWQDDLASSYHYHNQHNSYTVISVDGSQVYPDRHCGISCFLVNIGTVVLHYGAASQAQFASVPAVFGFDEDEGASQDIVNCKRQELELQAGLDWYRHIAEQQKNDKPILLFDGSLIFWHLEAKNSELRTLYLPRYLAILEQLYAQKALVASYISLPKSRDLVNLLKAELCDFNPAQLEVGKAVDPLVDATIASFYLEPYQRTTLFKSSAPITRSYPESLAPYFFYLHLGHEIGRVEIPAWLAADKGAIDLIAQAIIDQSIKGRGYPVALAEAHEQAVIKGPDRDFFYHLLQKMGIERHHRLQPSQKLMKKRGIGI